uniref:Ricin B lectin domain-containing protein n=1 Tax=Setaria digitata TaxID=48799 RepID=A0A915PTQ2_9BILA
MRKSNNAEKQTVTNRYLFPCLSTLASGVSMTLETCGTENHLWELEQTTNRQTMRVCECMYVCVGDGPAQ